MGEIQQIPEWLGAAVVGAAVAAIGFVAKLFLEWIANIRAGRRRRLAQLVELQSLLRASLASFRIQNEHARRLASLILKSHPQATNPNDGFERLFAGAYSTFTPEEKEIHEIIRSITVNSLRPINQSMVDWLRRDTYFKAYRQRGDSRRVLAAELASLEAHLILWHAKYEAWIPDKPQHSLVYLADEERHGIGFPSKIDTVIDEVLALY
jgi:hypothetical protein